MSETKKYLDYLSEANQRRDEASIRRLMEERRNLMKRRITIVLMSCVTVGIGLGTFFVSPEVITEAFSQTTASIFVTVIAAGLAIGITTFQRYIKPTEFASVKYGASNAASLAFTMEMVENTVNGLLRKRGMLFEPKAPLTESERADLVRSLEKRILREASDSYVKSIQQHALEQVTQKVLNDRFEASNVRLQQVILDLTKRGGTNLTTGMVAAGLGMLGLMATLIVAPFTSDLQTLIAYFVPKVALVLMSELLAFFFLRLYRKSLDEIKYFHNEVTNLEHRELALQLALQSDDASLRRHVVEMLAGTERNFVLERGQSTVDLERERMSTERTRFAMKEAASMLRGRARR